MMQPSVRPTEKEAAMSRKVDLLLQLMAALLILVAFAVRVSLSLAVGASPTVDVERFFVVARVVDQGGDPYSLPSVYFPYPPLSAYIIWLCLRLANVAHINFHSALSIFVSAADAAIACTIWKALRSENASSRLVWTALYAVNPASVLISGAHVQMDSLPLLMCLLAVVAAEKGFFMLAGVLFGLGIMVKPTGLLVAPALLMKRDKGSLATSLFGATVVAAGVLSLSEWEVRRTLAYALRGGGWDVGLVFLVRRLWPPAVPYIWRLMRVAGVAAVILTLYALRNQSSYERAVGTFTAWFAVGGGIAVQYMVWPLPFSLLRKDVYALPYTIVSTLAMVALYASAYPKAVLGLTLPADAQLAVRSVTSVLFVVLCLAWTGHLVYKALAREGTLHKGT